MTAGTNEALDALVKRLRDPWNHSEDLCDEAADMLTAQAAKLAEAEADADRLAEALERLWFHDAPHSALAAHQKRRAAP